MMFNFKEASAVFVVNIRCGLLGFVMGVIVRVVMTRRGVIVAVIDGACAH